MTPSLRKYHRLVWRLLSAAIPVVFIAAVVALPQIVKVRQPLSYQAAALPKVWKTASNDSFIARWRNGGPDGEQQLEVEVIKPLVTPATLVYLSEKPGSLPEQGTLVGKLIMTGMHRFRLGKASTDHAYTLLFFDPIKSKVIDTLSLSEGLNDKTSNKQ
ncbi:MAG: hypothetical protein JNK77_06675 [Saprospiraceae bacterium]|nr:hypothetical protein [Saprospiraceae bacterium]